MLAVRIPCIVPHGHVQLVPRGGLAQLVPRVHAEAFEDGLDRGEGNAGAITQSI